MSHQTSYACKNVPVESVCSLEPSLLVTLHVINTFLASFLSREDSITNVLPSGIDLDFLGMMNSLALFGLKQPSLYEVADCLQEKNVKTQNMSEDQTNI